MDTQTISIRELASDYEVSADNIQAALGLRGFVSDIEVTDAELAEIHETLAAKFFATYTYTAKDGEEITGTLEKIGEQIIGWHGDRATQDNQEPWIDLDDWGNYSPREYTLDEVIEWIASAEDRPVKHVRSALVSDDTERMTPEALQRAREIIGSSRSSLAIRLGVREDTFRKWESGRDPIPYGLPKNLRDLCAGQIGALRDLMNSL